MNMNIIPFGKYKGQPVEVLAQDRQYAEWIMAQPWFRDRYTNLYTVIVNFGDPAETPEHNRLQARFINPEFCQAVAAIAAYVPSMFSEPPQFEMLGFDVVYDATLNPEGSSDGIYVEVKPSVGDDYPAIIRKIRASLATPITTYVGKMVIREPSPAKNGNVVLLLEKYVGAAVTQKDFENIIFSAGIRAVFLSDVESELAAS